MVDGTLITWSLTGTAPVTGKVTGYEYENLPGVTITVTNLDTNEDDTTTVDQDGAYSIDLGDTGAFPGGYSIGDEIEISCTHRDATRTWKRRYAGVTLQQDVHFTHGTWLGAMRKAKLVATEVFTSQSGTTLTIRDAHARGVVRILKNGEELDEDDWTFTRPSTITLATGATTSDVYEVDKLLHRTEADAKLSVVQDGDAPVRNSTARYYLTPLPTRVPDLQDISEALAAAALRDRVYAGLERTDEEAKTYRRQAEKALEDIRTGKRQLTDQDGAFITPSAQSTTTPQSSARPTRQVTRYSDSHTRIDI